MANHPDNKVPTISEGYETTERPEGTTQAQLIEGELASERGEGKEGNVDQSFWLNLARTSCDESTDYLQSGIFDRFQRSYSLAKSKHPSGSKYYTQAYQHRSKLFRGKTAAAIRKNEAAAAVALFSTRDAVSITAENSDDKEQVEIADVIHDLANFHFAKGPKWFLTCIGAYNEAQTVSVLASKQYWEYEEVDGKVLVDQPTIDLIPIENLRISPSCDWVDPVNSSPYAIIITPMFIGDILERMDSGEWLPHSSGALRSTSEQIDSVAVRTAREGRQNEDRLDQTSAEDEFQIVFVHENFIRYGGEEVHYFTAGKTLLLSDPKLLEEAYPHCTEGKRPLAFGRTAIEPHNIFSTSLPERVEGAQIAANEIANQRKDNVELVMNKRTFATRNGGVDYRNLMRNAPGSVVLMNRLDAVRQEDMRDVTGSAYQEQHMINADFDEQAGTFSNASVSTSRTLNETVGGMDKLDTNSNVLTEYQLRIFSETWIEHVTSNTAKMVQFYTDDKVIKEITGKDITNEQLRSAKISPRVSVGFGSTDPQKKIQKLMFGLQTLAQIDPKMMEGINMEEITKEVFGALGYNDGKRFFPEKEEGENPEVAELSKMVEQLTQVIEGKKVEEEAKNASTLKGKEMDNAAKVEVANIKNQGDERTEAIKAQSRREELLLTLQTTRQLKLTELALGRKTTTEKVMKEAGVANVDQQIRLLDTINKRKEVHEKKRELDYKISTGNDGV